MFYVKESIATGHNQYWERAVRRSPFKDKEAAIALCDRSCRDDNEPFICDEHGVVLHTGKRGREYK